VTKLCRLNLVCAGVVLFLLASRPVGAEPLNVAPGSDPGGVAVAVITTPFALGSKSISQSLARDGEGVAIGWDFSKRPKSSETNADLPTPQTVPQVITVLTGGSKTRLVPAFVDRLRPSTWAQAVAFIARTPARIVMIPFATNTEADWIAFRAAAEHFPDLLFVVPARSSDNNAEEEAKTPGALSYPAQFHLSNVLSVSATANPNADIVLALPSDKAATDVALGVTIKTLLLCPSQNEITEPAMSKLEALAKLGTLGTSQTKTAPQQGSQSVTPCAKALN